MIEILKSDQRIMINDVQLKFPSEKRETIKRTVRRYLNKNINELFNNIEYIQLDNLDNSKIRKNKDKYNEKDQFRIELNEKISSNEIQLPQTSLSAFLISCEKIQSFQGLQQKHKDKYIISLNKQCGDKLYIKKDSKQSFTKKNNLENQTRTQNQIKENQITSTFQQEIKQNCQNAKQQNCSSQIQNDFGNQNQLQLDTQIIKQDPISLYQNKVQNQQQTQQNQIQQSSFSIQYDILFQQQLLLQENEEKFNQHQQYNENLNINSSHLYDTDELNNQQMQHFNNNQDNDNKNNQNTQIQSSNYQQTTNFTNNCVNNGFENQHDQESNFQQNFDKSFNMSDLFSQQNSNDYN
ncbi:hypothetical protein PPERSA_07198 [Pseudocohnilembus persalinus]|uniref:Uncharacterized protein n=1 Tax=Pseudocohnilembus persalinus TaxID=266149 RepID=A0A0V0QD26_PSEPJ|nr:hypothetical protein PPERSA_07198 [Pseudocohnilembus persalinus]|eukprot:KRX00091.1 hypothetical protein PPERSA_07198 [Pseudocohnilembus persalinus]